MKYCPTCQASYPLAYTACPKDQTPLQLATDLMPGLVLRGKYEILEKLGAGGMGAVYKARHLAFDELRAIKFVGSHLLADESALARFRSEAVVARRLQHQNAVKVEDLDTTDDGRSFIVMEYVEGRSLRDLLFHEGDVPTKRILALARQACGALGAAHALGIVHRDIKPDNLMVVTKEDGSEILKVADFGLAKVREGFELASDKALTQTGFLVGTPPYMSPEQSSGLDVDGRSDLYSLGVVLYEMLTGRLPFRSDSPLGMLIHHRETPPQPPAALGVPQPVAAFLMKALAKRREDRFQTAGQMDEALRQLTLLSLPEFVGQGIREGFDPQWAGSRHASRMTTLQVAPTSARPTVQGRPGARTSADRAPRANSAQTARDRSVTSPDESEPAQPSSTRFWMWTAGAALIGLWFLTSRPSQAPQAEPAPVAVAPAPVLHSVAATPETTTGMERTDGMIRFDIERLLGESTALRSARIQVEVANGVATLVGEAPSQTAAQLATSLAASVPGVRQVFSTLQGPAGTQTATAAGQPAEPPSVAAAAQPQPVLVEPTRTPTARGEDVTREQVRVLMERAREKMEARNPEGAEADLVAALKLDPNNPTAKDALERLKNRPQSPQGPPGPPGPGPRPTP